MLPPILLFIISLVLTKIEAKEADQEEKTYSEVGIEKT